MLPDGGEPAVDARVVAPDAPPDLPPGPQVMVTNEKRPTSIALHAGHVLWTTDPPVNVGKGPLAAWIQIVAIREALMMRRSTRREDSDDGDSALVDIALTEPVLAQTRRLYKDAFAIAFREALHGLDERERMLLRLCFVENAGAEDIARLFKVHRVTAFRWLRDARAKLLDRTRDCFMTAMAIPASEVDSVMRSLATSLTVSW